MSGSGGALAALLPLVICGYLFNLLVYPLRYFTVRAEGQRLFFMSAGSGLVLGALFFVAGDALQDVACIRYFCWLPGLGEQLNQSLPASNGSHLVLTFVGAIALAMSVNFALRVFCLFVDKRWPAGSEAAEWVYERLSDRLGSPLAKLLRRAVNEQKLVMVTLQSRKVYCGRVFEAPAGLDDEGAYFQLLPKFSTFRNKDDLRLGERTDYPAIALWEAQQAVITQEQILAQLHRDARNLGGKESSSFQGAVASVEAKIDSLKGEAATYGYARAVRTEDWLKVIPVAEIESITFFDIEAYESWFKREPAANKQDDADQDESNLGG